MLTNEQKIKQLKRTMACTAGDKYKKAVQQLNALEEKTINKDVKICQKQKKSTTSQK